MNMKRISKVLIVAVIAVLVIGLAACGKPDPNSKFLGAWDAVAVKIKDKETKLEDYSKAGSDFTMTMVFRDDGKTKANVNGSAGTGNWEEKDGKVTISDNTGASMKGKIDDDGRLLLTYEKQDFTIILERHQQD